MLVAAASTVDQLPLSVVQDKMSKIITKDVLLRASHLYQLPCPPAQTGCGSVCVCMCVAWPDMVSRGTAGQTASQGLAHQSVSGRVTATEGALAAMLMKH